VSADRSPEPRVGVGVLVWRDGRVLLGRRRGSHGAGTWAPPGGHLAFGEEVADCARREVAEETGLGLGAVTPGPFVNDVFASEGKHYVTLFVMTTQASGEPELREPDKCAGWGWYCWGDWPEPLFAPLKTLVDSGYVPAGAT